MYAASWMGLVNIRNGKPCSPNQRCTPLSLLGLTLRSFYEEVSARDVEVILNRHAKLEDIDGLSADAAATSPQAKAAKAKCVQGHCVDAYLRSLSAHRLIRCLLLSRESCAYHEAGTMYTECAGCRASSTRIQAVSAYATVTGDAEGDGGVRSGGDGSSRRGAGRQYDAVPGLQRGCCAGGASSAWPVCCAHDAVCLASMRGPESRLMRASCINGSASSAPDVIMVATPRKCCSRCARQQLWPCPIQQPPMLQVQGSAPQPAAAQEDALRPWVVALRRSVVELRGMLADLGAKQWQLQVRRHSSAGNACSAARCSAAPSACRVRLPHCQYAAPMPLLSMRIDSSRACSRDARQAAPQTAFGGRGSSATPRTCPQVVRHGGQFEATVTAETTQLVVLPQSDGAAVTPAALLKAVARGEYGAPALGHLRSRLAGGQLHMVTPKCGSDPDTV